ncbi:MAG: FAD-binding domain-containing protein [Betaproteobacteria bacterium]
MNSLFDADPATAAPAWADALPPTRSAALARIARVRPAAYARTRNHLDGAVTGLSPYLTHGLVTLRQVLAGVLGRGPLPVQHKLVFELGWREFFRHAWGHQGGLILESLHPGPRADAAYARTLPDDIRQARTGVPVVDRAVQTLYATGTLHNHARMWLASYVVHLRHVHWRAGADWLVAHLADGDLASNHLSWQWVAGTGSHKPYLFNADNVARYAPPAWHSAGTVVDQPYEALDRAARAPQPVAGPGPATAAPTPEPPLHATPPPALRLGPPDAGAAERLRGREVWLVHPWALRPPPADVPADAVVIGLYPQEHHRAWPWPAARWQWVDEAMAAVAPQRWFASAGQAAAGLASAARVRSVDDPPQPAGFRPLLELDAAPSLFPPVPRPCGSFSQWWTRATRGLQQAGELL